MILYINACVRGASRTDRIARAYLSRFAPDDVTQLRLADAAFRPLDEETLEKRSQLIARRDYSDPMFDAARQFALADEIVISAPLWDFSFPALLKVYLENIYVTGIVSRYSEKGVPVGLCRAKKLTFVSTSGGPFDARFGFDCIRALAQTCFGIDEVHLINAEMLDVDGFDAEKIVLETIRNLKSQK